MATLSSGPETSASEARIHRPFRLQRDARHKLNGRTGYCRPRSRREHDAVRARRGWHLPQSDTSARVGWGFSIMLSSICVAVITGFSAQWHASTIFFLEKRHVFGRHLDTQITPGDHDSVAGLDDLVEIMDSLGFFDLRDDRIVRSMSFQEQTRGDDVIGRYARMRGRYSPRPARCRIGGPPCLWG